MNSVKIAYMVLQVIFEIALLCVAVLAPIYITPGYYYWSAICLFLMIASSHGSTQRMNGWRDFGSVE